jgi:hypothetical protein
VVGVGDLEVGVGEGGLQIAGALGEDEVDDGWQVGTVALVPG